jgi:thiamine kinase-like enzyme
MTSTQVTAFEGDHRIASGSLQDVTQAIRELFETRQIVAPLIFDNQTGAQIDLALRLASGNEAGSTHPNTAESADPRSVGRPRLGVIAREVTLLPRHWEWLGQQEGGASAALRKLIDRARRENAGEDRMRAGREALYRFMTAIAGNAPGYEDALRALFAGNSEQFINSTLHWPTDIREHAWQMAPASFGYAPSPLDGAIPFNKRQAVAQAVTSAFGAAEIKSIERITHGASGADVFKIVVEDTEYLLRIEGPPDDLRNPSRQYACLKIASEAGIAPRLIYAEEKHGVAMTQFIRSKHLSPARPRKEFLRTVATLVKKLHATPLFPPLIDYLDGVDILIRRCRATGVLPAKFIEVYLSSYDKLTRAYRAAGSDLVSSHNDLNSGNLLLEGDRAWLVDWEAAFAADRYVDLAAVANFFTNNDQEIELILETYFGAPLNDIHRARLFLMQQVNRTFYAMVMLNYVASAHPETRLTAHDLKASNWSDVRGELNQIATSGTKVRLACSLLNEASHVFKSPRFSKAIETIRSVA